MVWHFGTAFSFVLFLLCVFSGCSSPLQPAPDNGTVSATGETIAESLPSESLTATPVPVKPAATPRETRVEPVMVTTVRTAAGSGAVLLDDTYTLTIKEYKEYPFKDMGYEFLYEGDRFQVSVQSEKPVILYVVGYMDAIRIQASDNTPHYEEGVSKLQWGNVEPVFFWERVTDRTGTFAITGVGRYSLVVDPRWMTYDKDWMTGRPFTFRLRITKV